MTLFKYLGYSKYFDFFVSCVRTRKWVKSQRNVSLMEKWKQTSPRKLSKNSLMLLRVPVSIMTWRHSKRSLMPWVVVVRNTGRACVAASGLLLVWHQLFRFFFFLKIFFVWKVGVIPKEGRAQPLALILLLVRQWHRTLGTFSHDVSYTIL